MERKIIPIPVRRTMRKSCVLLILALFSVSLNAQITVAVKNQPLKEILKVIETKSEYRFFYNEGLKGLDKITSLELNNVTINQAMTVLLSNTGIGFKVEKKNLIVLVSETKANENAQRNVTGTVTDQNDEPIIGASVMATGTKIGTVTDINGNFTLNASDKSLLTITYIGYSPIEVKVGSQSSLKIKLIESSKSLEEVVVVGYGTQKKSDITGSVTSIGKDRLSQIPVTNVMNALEGAVAGVSISQSSAAPGSTPSISVRGASSINASTNPLVILDGMPFNGSVNNINPNDIASMEILKDASAVAIYGTRGSNGVILITTKKGTSGKPMISYSGYMGVEDIAHVLTPMNATQYVQKYADYMSQTGQSLTTPVPNLSEVTNYNAGKTTDWIKEATQTGLIQDHSLSIAGGADNIKYYISGDFQKEKGVVKGYQFQKAGIRSNLEANVTNYLTAGLNLAWISSNNNGGTANLMQASAMSPYGQLYNAQGKYEIYPMNPETLYPNPMLGLYKSNINEQTDINGNFFAEVKPTFIKGLKYRLNVSYDYNPTHKAKYTGRDANDLRGTAQVEDYNTKMWIVENILTYTQDWGKHHADFTGLYSAQQNNYFDSQAQTVGFVNDLLSYNNLSVGSTPSVSSNATQYTMLSQMGRFNYSYNSRYLLTATARRDGYSAFGSNTNKYATFPSIALGWNISNEHFMDASKKFLDKLKLRLSYGTSGNMAIGVNQTVSIDKNVLNPFNGVATVGYISDIMGNSNLHWESTKGFNIGADFSFINGRINGSVEVYNKQTSDLLLKQSIPGVTGYSSVWNNLGKISNKGIEVTLNTVNITAKDFKWSTSLNFSTNRNRILDLYGDQKSDIGNQWFIGQALGVIYDYKKIGVWQQSEATQATTFGAKPGDLKFLDENGDGKITAADKVIQGQTAPKWTGGITNTFKYKNLNLSIFIQTSQGALKNNVTYILNDQAGRINLPADLHYWTSTNQSNSVASLAYMNTYHYGYPCDASFTRIKDLTLSYMFSPKMLEHTLFNNLTLYASGRNLYTFTKWFGWDPEYDYYNATTGANNNNNYPNTRTFVFGVNVSLK